MRSVFTLSILLLVGCGAAAEPHAPAATPRVSQSAPTAPVTPPPPVARAHRTVRLGGVGRVFPSDLVWLGDSYGVIYTNSQIGGPRRLHYMRVSPRGEVLLDRELTRGRAGRSAFDGRHLGIAYEGLRAEEREHRDSHYHLRFMRLTPDGRIASDVAIEPAPSGAAHVAWSATSRQWFLAWGQHRAPVSKVIGVFLDEEGTPTRRVQLGHGRRFHPVTSLVSTGDRFVLGCAEMEELIWVTVDGEVHRQRYGEIRNTLTQRTVVWDGDRLLLLQRHSEGLPEIFEIGDDELRPLASVDDFPGYFAGGRLFPVDGGYILVAALDGTSTTGSRYQYFSRHDAGLRPVPAAAGRLAEPREWQMFGAAVPAGCSLTVLHTIGHYNEHPEAYLTFVPCAR